jgi:hypothetical protein
MAKDSPISYLPGTDPDALKANLEYQTALANLKDALDARKNRLFNPALASFAAAMLDPGHGGGFGEALGRSVRAYSAGEEEDIKQRQELAAKNLDVAQLGIGLQRQRMLMQDYADQPVLNNAPAGGALSAAGADQSKPSATPSGGALSSSSSMGIPFMAPQGVMSKNEFARSMLMNSNGTISKADIEMKYAEYLNKMRTEKEGYTIDYGTGMIYRIPTAELGTGRVPGPGGNQVYPYVSKDDAILFQNLPESDPRVQRALRRYFPDYVPPDQRGAPQAPAPSVAAAPGAPSAGATPPAAPSAGASATPGKMKTVDEQKAEERRLEIEKAAREEEVRGIAKGSVEYFDKAGAAADKSQELFSAAENMNSIIKAQPGAFELLNKPGIARAVLRAAEEGIRIGNFGSISIPSSTLASYKLNTNQLNALNMYANQLAIAQSANRQMVRVPGEGSTSDLETNLSNAVLTVPNASPEVLKFINEFTMARARNADLRFKKLNELRQQGMSLADARASQEMRDIRKDYEIELRSLAQKNAQFLTAAKKSSKAAPKNGQKPPSENSRRLDEALRD